MKLLAYIVLAAIKMEATAYVSKLQRSGEVRYLIAHHLEDLTPLLGELATRSRDFH